MRRVIRPRRFLQRSSNCTGLTARTSLKMVWLVCVAVGLICATAAILHMHSGRARMSTVGGVDDSGRAGAIADIVGSETTDGGTRAAAGTAAVTGKGAGADMEGAQPEIRLVNYTVKPGDTLSSIAEEFNSSVDSIAYINGLLSPDRISVGKQLSVIANASGIVVEVSRGDTLSDLSARYNVPVDVIVRVNHLSAPDNISAGQSLILPGARPGGRSIQSVARSSALRWPVTGPVTSGFGWRVHPITGDSEFHQGIDIAASEGTSVVAAASGTISSRGWYGGYGRLIIIDHGNGIETRYGHLSGYAVDQGGEVSAGQVVGYIGSSGISTGPHLHFEVRVNGEAVDPKHYLP